MLTRRDLLSAAVALPGSALLERWHFTQAPSPAAPAPRVADAIAHVHPELRPALEGLLKTMDSSPLTAESLPKQRQMMNGFAAPVLPSPVVTERTIAGPP